MIRKSAGLFVLLVSALVGCAISNAQELTISWEGSIEPRTDNNPWNIPGDGSISTRDDGIKYVFGITVEYDGGVLFENSNFRSRSYVTPDFDAWLTIGGETATVDSINTFEFDESLTSVCRLSCLAF